MLQGLVFCGVQMCFQHLSWSIYLMQGKLVAHFLQLLLHCWLALLLYLMQKIYFPLVPLSNSTLLAHCKS